MKAILVLVLCYTSLSSPYKILGIFPHLGKSHFDFFEPLMKALASKGHEVTVISNFPQKAPFPNLTDINLRPEDASLATNSIDVDMFSKRHYQHYLTPLMLLLLGIKSCTENLPQKDVQDLIKEQPHFDLIIMEFFNTKCFLGVAHKLRAPVIGLSSCTLMPFFDSPLAYPSNPAYVPNNFMPFSDSMGFLERVENTVCYVYHHFWFNVVQTFIDDYLVRKYVDQSSPGVDEIIANTSVIILNTHFTNTRPRPVVPGFVEVAGLHIGKPKKLPQVIKKNQN